MAIEKKINTLLKFDNPPRFLFLHCGPNDIGEVFLHDLLHAIDPLLTCIQNKMPGTTIIWSQILPRFQWRNSAKEKAMERSRNRFNRAMAKTVLNGEGGGYYIKYPELITRNVQLFVADCQCYLSKYNKGSIPHIQY